MEDERVLLPVADVVAGVGGPQVLGRGVRRGRRCRCGPYSARSRRAATSAPGGSRTRRRRAAQHARPAGRRAADRDRIRKPIGGDALQDSPGRSPRTSAYRAAGGAANPRAAAARALARASTRRNRRSRGSRRRSSPASRGSDCGVLAPVRRRAAAPYGDHRNDCATSVRTPLTRGRVSALTGCGLRRLGAGAEHAAVRQRHRDTAGRRASRLSSGWRRSPPCRPA